MDAYASPEHAPVGMHEGPQNPYQGNPLQVIRQRLWLIMLVAVVVTGLAAAFSFLQTPMYSASIKVLLEQGPASNDAEMITSISEELEGLQLLATTVMEVGITRPVAEDIVQQSNLKMSPEVFQSSLGVAQVSETQVIEFSYTDSDPERAKRVVDTTANVFSQQFSEISPSNVPVTATVLDSASLPTAPVSPDPARNILLGMLLGLMLGVGLAFLLDYLNTGWRSDEEVEQFSGIPNFASIPRFRIPKNREEN